MPETPPWGTPSKWAEPMRPFSFSRPSCSPLNALPRQRPPGRSPHPPSRRMAHSARPLSALGKESSWVWGQRLPCPCVHPRCQAKVGSPKGVLPPPRHPWRRQCHHSPEPSCLSRATGGCVCREAWLPLLLRPPGRPCSGKAGSPVKSREGAWPSSSPSPKRQSTGWELSCCPSWSSQPARRHQTQRKSSTRSWRTLTVTSSTSGQRNRGSERKRGLSKVTQEGDALGARAFWGARWGWGVLGTLPSKCLPTVGAPLGGGD